MDESEEFETYNRIGEYIQAAVLLLAIVMLLIVEFI
jgi:hypothetical protein